MRKLCLLIMVFISLFSRELIMGREKKDSLEQSMHLSMSRTDSTNITKREKNVIYDDCKTIDSVFVMNKDSLKLIIKQMPSGEIVKYDRVKWADNLIKVRITKNKILIDKVIERKLFLETVKDIYKKSTLHFAGINSVDDKGITLSVSVCVPDTDDCYFFNYVIFFDGKTKIIQEETAEDEF